MVKIVNKIKGFQISHNLFLLWLKNCLLHIFFQVTVKIIDFAHSTFEGFLDDPIVHEGPDAGFLKGLDTLIDVLTHALEPSSPS